MHGLAIAVAHDLDFDVARLLQVFFDVDGIVAEGGTSFGAGGRQRNRKLVFIHRDLHAAATAAGRGLDDDRIADFGTDARRFLIVGHAAIRTRNDRNAETFCGALGFDLVAHDADMRGGRADEGNVVRFEDFGELGVLRQETVTWMDRIGAGDFAGSNDLMDIQIAIARRRRSNTDAFVGKPHMHGVSVGSRVDGYGLDAELLACTQDAQGNLAAIGYENFLKHHALDLQASGLTRSQPETRHIRRVGCRVTRMAVTVPERGEGIWFIVFIASMIRSVWPSLTCVPTSMKSRAPGAGDKYTVPTIGEGMAFFEGSLAAAATGVTDAAGSWSRAAGACA